MEFPDNNKIKQSVPDKFGENAKLLEDNLNKANWRVIMRYYFSGLGVFLITLFSIIAVIRLAISIF